MNGRARGAVAIATAMTLLAATFLVRAAAPGLVGGLETRGFLILGCVAKLGFQGLGALLALDCSRRFEVGNPVRRAWGLLSMGLAGFFLGQLVLARYQIVAGTESPFPSLAEAFFLPAYPLLITAVVVFVWAYGEAGFPIGSATERTSLVALVAVAGVLVGYPILAPVGVSDAPLLEKAINIAYPALDFVLLLPTALLARATLRLRGGNVQRVWLALLCGVLSLAVADIAFAYVSTLGWTHLDPVMDALFIASYGCLALGAALQRDLLA